jgi:hypothetical protein
MASDRRPGMREVRAKSRPVAFETQIRRGSQVVRPRSAKPLFTGSIPVPASLRIEIDNDTITLPEGLSTVSPRRNVYQEQAGQKSSRKPSRAISTDRTGPQHFANQARSLGDGTICEAQEIEALGYREDDEWVCSDTKCPARMIPCAWKGDKEYKRAPYFRTHPKDDHVEAALKLKPSTPGQRTSRWDGEVDCQRICRPGFFLRNPRRQGLGRR